MKGSSRYHKQGFHVRAYKKKCKPPLNGRLIDNNRLATVPVYICRPMRTIGGQRYLHIMITVQQRYVRVRVLRTTDQVLLCIFEFFNDLNET